ncbi:hypothetical protein SAMN05216368_101249 [Cryobacterium flavum]|uniref:Uncharacterized protein n=1 Tax=Cryobacterium flavum TaxID=1424659 RepID=A0A5E9FTL1_9MICO|nr:hypothetical protein SAMN05216368_101249 [Cryobacterium flavum]
MHDADQHRAARLRSHGLDLSRPAAVPASPRGLPRKRTRRLYHPANPGTCSDRLAWQKENRTPELPQHRDSSVRQRAVRAGGRSGRRHQPIRARARYRRVARPRHLELPTTLVRGPAGSGCRTRSECRVCTWRYRFASEHAREPGDREHLPSLQPARSSYVLSLLRSSRGTPSPPSTTLFGTIPVPYLRLTERAAALLCERVIQAAVRGGRYRQDRGRKGPRRSSTSSGAPA